MFINPFIATKLQFLKPDVYDGYYKVNYAKVVAHNGELAESQTRPEASWRKMLISQPPISKLVLQQSHYYYDHDVDVASGESCGITLGLLYRDTMNFGMHFDIPGQYHWEFWRVSHDLYRISVPASHFDDYKWHLGGRDTYGCLLGR